MSSVPSSHGEASAVAETTKFTRVLGSGWFWLAVSIPAVIFGCIMANRLSKKGEEKGKKRKLSEHDPLRPGSVAERMEKKFGYRFENGVLTDIATGGGFEFAVTGSKNKDQKRYEQLGEMITLYVFELLEEKARLEKVIIPVDARDGEGRGFFYASRGFETKKSLVVLIHGSGVVRAGQWSRKLIINNGLEMGTQLPYIREAKQRGFGVVLTNTNLHHDMENGHSIRGSRDSVEHGEYVWEHFIKNSKAEKIAIVAHSAGGYVTVKLAEEFSEDFEKRVRAIAYTDSAHIPSRLPVWKHFQSVAVNWVTSNAPLDSPLPSRRDDVERVSAGTTQHEETSPYAIKSVWEFIDEQFK